MRLGYDPQQQEQQYEDREVDWSTIDLPGWFECKVNHESEKQSKSGGRYLNVALHVTAGEASGATVWAMLTTSNRNAKAVEIGAKQIGELMWACGLKKGADSSGLVGKKLMVYIKGEETERWGLSPRPTSFKPIGREPDAAGFQSDPGADTDPYPPPGGEGPSPAGYDERNPPPDVDYDPPF